MQLNQNYVMSEAAYTESSKKKDVEKIEQLDRELRYMERSIATLKINSIKQEERDKSEITTVDGAHQISFFAVWTRRTEAAGSHTHSRWRKSRESKLRNPSGNCATSLYKFE